MRKQVPFSYENQTFLFDIPSAKSLSENTYFLINEWNLPISIYPSKFRFDFLNQQKIFFSSRLELFEELRLFFDEQIQLAADERTHLAVQPVINGQIEIKDLLDKWLKYIEECKIYTPYQEQISDEHIFSNVFQNVLHTGNNYEVLLQLEYRYFSEIEDMIKRRDKELQELDQK